MYEDEYYYEARKKENAKLDAELAGTFATVIGGLIGAVLSCLLFLLRVQTGGMTSDPTARKAINNVITREALLNCDFSGNVLDGVDQAEVYIRDAYILRDMRKDYNLFNSQLGILGTEKETFTKYLLKEKTISDIAEDQGITYESARQQMQKIKVRMKKQVKRFMDGQPGGIA